MRHLGHGQRFIGDGQVIEDGFLIHIHSLDAVLNDDGDFVGESGIVGEKIWHGKCQHVTVAVLVLQALAGKRSSASGASYQKAAGTHVGGGPDQVADALEAEHRVVNEEGNRVDSVIRIRRTSRDERAHRTSFGNAFLEDLSVFGFFVVEQSVHVDRLIKLADAGVNTHLAEQRFHAESTSFVWNDGYDELANLGVAQ